MTQGQSGTTEFKLRGISSAFTVSLRVSVANDGARWHYWHVDLHSGSGHNEIANCDGSPKAFLKAAAAVGRDNFTAIFCDRDEPRIRQLQTSVGADQRVICLNWDNKEVLPVLAERIEHAERRPRFAWGTVLVDPNGYFNDDTVPYGQIAEFAARFPRMDLVFNLNVRTYQMGKAHVTSGKWKNTFWPSPQDFQSLFHRKNWLVSNIRSCGGDRFCLFIGRSMKTGDHAALGIYSWDGQRGQRILSRIEGADVEETANGMAPLQELSGLPAASDVQGDKGSSDEKGQMDLWMVR